MARISIESLVKQALDSGYLSLEAEDALRSMLRQKYSEEAFEAFVTLQRAAMTGQVKQQSREAWLFSS